MYWFRDKVNFREKQFDWSRIPTIREILFFIHIRQPSVFSWHSFFEASVKRSICPLWWRWVFFISFFLLTLNYWQIINIQQKFHLTSQPLGPDTYTLSFFSEIQSSFLYFSHKAHSAADYSYFVSTRHPLTRLREPRSCSPSPETSEQDQPFALRRHSLSQPKAQARPMLGQVEQNVYISHFQHPSCFPVIASHPKASLSPFHQVSGPSLWYFTYDRPPYMRHK